MAVALPLAENLASVPRSKPSGHDKENWGGPSQFRDHRLSHFFAKYLLFQTYVFM